jgi:predicted esterase
MLAGLKYLRSLGFADLTRVAIVGYSGGADVTIYAAGAAPTAFRAVVVQAGDIPFASDLGLGFYVKWARPIKAPILLQYGREDAALSLGRALARALKGMGKDVTLLEYQGGHKSFGPTPWGEWAQDFLDFLTRRLSK